MGFVVNTQCVINTFNCCFNSVTSEAGVRMGTNASTALPSSNSNSIFIGPGAGGPSTSLCNIAIGFNAGLSQTTGDCNVFIGYQVGQNNNTGIFNVGVGMNALAGGFPGTSFSCNTAIGYFALVSLCGSAVGNTAVGHSAGYGVTTGINNTFIGIRAGCCVVTGSCNIIIGTDAQGTGLAGANGCLCIANGCFTPTFFTANSTGVGFCTSAPAARIHVTGCMVATSEITAYYSDRRLKENIQPISNALDKISHLNGVFYTPNKKAIGFGFEENKRHAGVIADEVEKVLPEVIVPAPFDVATNRESITGDFYKTVKYERIVPLLVASVKELKNKAEDLRTRLNNLKKIKP